MCLTPLSKFIYRFSDKVCGIQCHVNLHWSAKPTSEALSWKSTELPTIVDRIYYSQGQQITTTCSTTDFRNFKCIRGLVWPQPGIHWLLRGAARSKIYIDIYEHRPLFDGSIGRSLCLYNKSHHINFISKYDWLSMFPTTPKTKKKKIQ